MEDERPLLVDDGWIRYYTLLIFSLDVPAKGILLLTGLCVGLPARVWATQTLHQHRCSDGKPSLLMTALLFSDALELLLTPVVVAVVTAPCGTGLDHVLLVSFLVVRLHGLSLHQLVALEGTASFTHPKGAAVLSSLPCSLTLIITTLLPVTVVTVFPSNFNNFLMLVLLLAAPAGVTVAMCVLTCSAKGPSESPHSTRAERLIMSVSLITFLGLYGPHFLTIALSPNPTLPLCSAQPSVGEVMALLLMGLRLLADPLLCVLVCRLARSLS